MPPARLAGAALPRVYLTRYHCVSRRTPRCHLAGRLRASTQVQASATEPSQVAKLHSEKNRNQKESASAAVSGAVNELENRHYAATHWPATYAMSTPVHPLQSTYFSQRR